jgi:hypothetical protein
MVTAKVVGAAVLVGSVVFLATGWTPQAILGFWATVAVVVGGVHLLSGGSGWMR